MFGDVHGGTSHINFLSTSVYSALGVSAIMRYINRRFTYLLTYLLGDGCRTDDDGFSLTSLLMSEMNFIFLQNFPWEEFIHNSDYVQ